MKRNNLIVACAVLVMGTVPGMVQAQTLKSRVVQKPVKVRVSSSGTKAKRQLAPLGTKAVSSPDQLRQSSAAPIPAPVTASKSSVASPVAPTPAAGITQAQGNPPGSVTASKSRFHLDTLIAVSRDLRVADHPDHSAGMYFEMDPTFKLSEKLTLVGIFSGTKSFTGDLASKVDDGQLGLSMAAIPLDEKVFSLSPRLYFILPISEKSQDVTTLRTGVIGAMRLFIKPSNSIFSMYYQPSLARYFNEFDSTAKGGMNKAWKLKHKTSSDLNLGKNWSLNFVFELSSVWDYANEVSNDFNADQSINYQFNPMFALGLGHTTTGDFWNEDRSESKYSLTDPEMSEVYMALTISL